MIISSLLAVTTAAAAATLVVIFVLNESPLSLSLIVVDVGEM